MLLLSQADGSLVPHSSGSLGPPYRSVATRAIPVNVSIGCAKAAGGALRWDPLIGGISGIGAASSRVCVQSTYLGNSSNSARWSDALGLSLPLRVTTSGNHSIALTWTIDLAAAARSTESGCPPANLNYRVAIGASSSGFCESGTDLRFFLWATVEDPNGSGGYVGNISDAGNDNYTYWQNVSNCSNPGTLSCSNSTYGYQYLLRYGTNEVGSASAGLSGRHWLTMWVNGSNMLRTHQFNLVMGFMIYVGATRPVRT
jgi:hypothetical protein